MFCLVMVCPLLLERVRSGELASDREGRACFRSRSGIPLDQQRERSTERGVGLEPQRLSWHQAQAGKAGAQLLQNHARLQTRQRRAQAIVRPVTEGEVLPGILPMDVEAI